MLYNWIISLTASILHKWHRIRTDVLLITKLKEQLNSTHLGELKINVVIRFCLALQAQLDELKAAYKKAHKVELADEIDKKCNGDLKALILAKLGKGERQFWNL